MKKIINIFIAVLCIAFVFSSCSAPDKEGQKIKAPSELSGIATANENGDMMLVSDQMLEITVNGKAQQQNQFYLSDDRYKEYAEEHLYLKNIEYSYSDGKIIATPEFFVCKDICIFTSFGVLHYPEQWVENLKIESASDNSYTFNAVFDNKKVPLFTISCNTSSGEPIGKFVHPGDIDDTIDVIYVQMSEQNSDNGLNENQTEALYGMLDDFNYLAEALSHESDFTNEV